MDVLSAQLVHLHGQRDGQTVTLQAPLVIAADGGMASFTRRLGLAAERAEWAAVRAYFEGDIGDSQQIEAHWDRATMPGYGWIFPLGSGWVNVGLGCRTQDLGRLPTNLRSMLPVFVGNNPHARERLKHATRVGPIVGHPLRANAQAVTPLADHVLVAGEAAGLVNPFTGEGIAAAMVSGKMAAKHARRALESGEFSAQALAPYGRAFHRRFDKLHRSARLAQRALGVPWLLNRSIRRASHDPVYARQLAAVIIGRDLPAELFKSKMAIRVLLG
ncbi:MAG: NAD(P)/FAD-dependent oxidoreductase [Delftia sp.]|nr:NAD(P)/FAD-dependent oxidoreductase [Delftia sp.]